MSGIKGQNTKSIQKKSFDKGRYPVVGTKNLKFHHKASAGETIIDLTSLVTTGTGLTNPSPTDLVKIRLKDFKENLVYFDSSANGSLMEGIFNAYTIVDNQTIKLNYEAAEGEVFTGIFSNATINGTVIADVRTPGGSGSLLEDATDFNLGEAIPIDDLTNQFPIQIYRGVDAKLMKRNTGNAAYTGDDSVGNYQMIDRGDGWCQVIRFNIAGDVGDEDVCWSARGALGERPNLSVLQQVDSINGIVDLMKDDLLEATGFDVTDPTRYDGVPTNADLKAFGDKVQTLLQLLGAQVPIVGTPQPFTPNGSWTSNVTYSGYKQRIQNRLVGQVIITCVGGTPGPAVILDVDIPDGLEFDDTLLGSTNNRVGNVGIFDLSASILYGIVNTVSPTKIRPLAWLDVGVNEGIGSVTPTSPVTLVAGDFIEINFDIPIKGWAATQTLAQQLGL